MATFTRHEMLLAEDDKMERRRRYKKTFGILTNFVDKDVARRIMVHNPTMVKYIPSMTCVKVKGSDMMDMFRAKQAFHEIYELSALYDDLVLTIDATWNPHGRGHQEICRAMLASFLSGYPVNKVVLDYTKMFKKN
jgi:hypothetical protein